MIIHSRILFLKSLFRLIRCALYRLVKLIRKMPWNINQPQVCPVISIPLDIPASENRSYKFSRSLALVIRLAIGKDFITFSGVYDESVIVASLDAVIDLDIPVLQWCSNSFNLSLDALLNRRKNHP